ncbi:DNA-formamidopyrimidine glycosylase family protein [Pedobacter agri]|uniref:DNA-formamidopyrimidine glycosylase family protein n=1 Tax=Pedobacter agri TaxID=454586 RepID=UPI00292D1774|nr:DNA-formamidopyrimidine glycosylase family protein [Pedobacter agri]
MPELPDLAVIAKNLKKRIEGKTVKALELHVSKKTVATELDLFKAFLNCKIKSVFREGKELRIEIGENILGLQLMLHGDLKLVTAEAPKFPIFHLDFGGERLYLTDHQNQARPILNPEPTDVPDALDVSRTVFNQMLSRKKTDIKTVLLDQKNIRGIGNAYADEILYHAEIAPNSIANKVPGDELYQSMQSILYEAIDQISKLDPDRITGENRDFMKVHLPKTMETLKGEAIIVDRKGPRKSYYVASQKVYN